LGLTGVDQRPKQANADFDGLDAPAAVAAHLDAVDRTR
jgi:hypothetical protein